MRSDDGARVTWTVHAGQAVLSVERDLGIGGCEELTEAVTKLLAARPVRLAIDLTEVGFISSMAIGQLMMLAQGVRRWGGVCAIGCRAGPVRDTLVRCRLPRLAVLAGTRAEALGATG